MGDHAEVENLESDVRHLNRPVVRHGEHDRLLGWVGDREDRDAAGAEPVVAPTGAGVIWTRLNPMQNFILNLTLYFLDSLLSQSTPSWNWDFRS